MVKKQKSSQCSSGWCSNHLLSITTIQNAQCHYRKKIRLRLCPKYSNLHNCFRKTVPIINDDHKHYTPCFILEDDKTYYMDNDERLISSHKHKLQSQGSRTIVITHYMVAKHGRKTNYCSVCRVDYEDYLIHIEDFSHRNQLRSNKFSKYILETQEKIKDAMQKEYVQAKVLDETNEVEKVKRIQQQIALKD